jgi:glyoxylase-like metal-dependent hydrolase (beta-lactamase superfamily II)
MVWVLSYHIADLGAKRDVRIYPISVGFCCCYLLKGEGCIMIDGGAPNRLSQFEKEIARIRVKPEEIRLIVITHGHFDHIGSARDVQRITGARIAMHHRDKDCLEQGIKLLPPGVTTWGRVLIKMMRPLMPRMRIPVSEVDLVLGDEGLSLQEYGIPGRIVHTPGHTAGSVSVVLETGEAFVGDLAMNKFPLGLGPGLPIFAEDIQAVKESWKLLLEEGAEKAFPAHGKPFSVGSLSQALSL